MGRGRVVVERWAARMGESALQGLARSSGRPVEDVRADLEAGERAWAALAAGDDDRAAELAHQILARDPEEARFFGAGQDHHAHLVQGFLRLRAGDVTGAEHELLAAGRPLDPSSTLRSFGPNMLLAEALLRRGRHKAVLSYLVQCGGFWCSPGSRRYLRPWQDDIAHGRIPDFGPNLTYGTGLTDLTAFR